MLRVERIKAGVYRWNRYSIVSVITSTRLKEWRVTHNSDFVNQCGSLRLAKQAVLTHYNSIQI